MQDFSEPLKNFLEAIFRPIINEAIKKQFENLKPPTQSEPNDIVGVKEAAKLLNYTVKTIYTKVNRGKIPYLKNAGEGKLYFSRKKLLGLLQEGRQNNKGDSDQNNLSNYKL